MRPDAHDRPCTMNDQTSKIDLTRIPQAEQAWPSAGRVLTGHQSNPGGNVACVCEIRGISNRRDEGAGHNRPNPWHGQQSFGERIGSGGFGEFGGQLIGHHPSPHTHVKERATQGNPTTKATFVAFVGRSRKAADRGSGGDGGIRTPRQAWLYEASALHAHYVAEVSIPPHARRTSTTGPAGDHQPVAGADRTGRARTTATARGGCRWGVGSTAARAALQRAIRRQ